MRKGGEQAASESYREALALAEELGMRPLADRCRRALDQLPARSGGGP